MRDLLALATAMNATLIMPPLVCTCDRYWGNTQNCRMPTAPQDMPLPFRCSQDALFEVKRWNDLQMWGCATLTLTLTLAPTPTLTPTLTPSLTPSLTLTPTLTLTLTLTSRFREATFLEHPNVPPELVASAVRVVVHKDAAPAAPGSAEARFTATLRPGTPMGDVAAAVDAANPGARLVEIGVEDVRRLCKWLGSSEKNAAFNRVQRYALTESARFCPSEDHNTEVANVKGWNWRNPFTAYNCTWGFHHPTDYPEPPPGAAAPCALDSGAGMHVVERANSTTCARAMLCDWNTHIDGHPNPGRQSRCNLEGYGGVDYEVYGNQTSAALAAMPGGRCPQPPGDVPGGGLGFDREGHWVGQTQGAAEMARLLRLERER